MYVYAILVYINLHADSSKCFTCKICFLFLAYAGIADKFSSALAKPIFCNPGKYETWEVVDSAACTEEQDSQTSTCEQETYKKGNVDSANDVQNNQKCSVCETSAPSDDTQCSSDAVDGFMEVRTDSFNKVKDYTLPVCHSIENISDNEFVVCELDSTEASDNVKFDLCGNEDSNFSNYYDKPVCTDEDNVVATEYDEKFEKEVDVDTRNCQCSDNSGAVNLLSQNLDQCDGFAVSNDNEITESQMIHFEDPSNMYAVCKEILDEEVLAHVESDMECTSCHSLENIDDGNVMNVFDDSVEQCYDSVNDEIPLTKGTDEIIIDSKCLKQLSISDTDTNDSGILGDCGNENQDNSCSVMMSSLQCRPSVDSLSAVKKPGSDCVASADKTDYDNNGSKTKPMSINKSRMSLDLPVSYHPAQKSDEVSSPKKKISPVSPQLSPGKRSFAPKLFSVQRKIAQSPIQLFRHLPIVKNMYMSPLLAPDELLAGLPPVHMTVSMH